MRTRGTITGFAGLLAVAGCGSVVIDDDDELGAASGGPANAVAVGSGGSSAVGSAGGAGGSSMSGSSTGASGSAATGGGVEDASLVWSEAFTREVATVGGFGDFAALAWPDHAPVPLLISHREGADQKLRKYSLEDVEDAWVGSPRLVNRYSDQKGWVRWPERGGLVAAPMFGTGYGGVPSPGWGVALNIEESESGYAPDRVHFRDLWHEGPKGGSPDADRPHVRAMAMAGVTIDGSRVFAHVLGDDALSLQMLPHNGTATTMDDVACADRSIAVAALGLTDQFVVAHAAGGSPCGAEPMPPDTAELVFFGTGGDLVARSEPVPMSAPVTEIQVARGGASLWLAARLEGDDGLELARMSLDGVVHARARLTLAADRQYALATWNEELVVVDAGRDGDDTSRLRARVIDASGAAVLESASLAPSSAEITAVAAVGSPDGDAVLVAFADREENGERTRYGVVRADVTGSR